tara:strand:+ start:438 stop:761 length:324 start_codon:yes stop_codon:yes gene_type:complete
MDLDNKTKGMLGMKSAAGIWDRLDLFRRPAKHRTARQPKAETVKATATVATVKAEMRQYVLHAVTGKAGFTRSIVFHATPSLGQAKAHELCRVKKWVFVGCHAAFSA